MGARPQRGHDGRATLLVSNRGPVIPAGAVEGLLEPFRRLNGARTDHGRGLGLGLSIVSAIATAHGAELRATPRAEGGLDVEVSFPPAPGAGRPEAPLHCSLRWHRRATRR